MQDTKITKQEEIGDILMSLGMSRTTANALAYMQDGNEVTRAKLETATRLRQPEVSIAMRQMIARGWVGERNVMMMPGKGRPYRIYSLKISFKDIIARLEEQQRKTGAGAQAKIERLKELTRASRTSAQVNLHARQ